MYANVENIMDWACQCQKQSSKVFRVANLPSDPISHWLKASENFSARASSSSSSSCKHVSDIAPVSQTSVTRCVCVGHKLGLGERACACVCTSSSSLRSSSSFVLPSELHLLQLARSLPRPAFPSCPNNSRQLQLDTFMSNLILSLARINVWNWTTLPKNGQWTASGLSYCSWKQLQFSRKSFEEQRIWRNVLKRRLRYDEKYETKDIKTGDVLEQVDAKIISSATQPAQINDKQWTSNPHWQL